MAPAPRDWEHHTSGRERHEPAIRERPADGAGAPPPARRHRCRLRGLTMHTGIVHEFDLERDGKAFGTIGMPFSVDRSPYFQVKVPYVVVRNGSGPRLCLMAGNHGDEYEGELTLAR